MSTIFCAVYGNPIAHSLSPTLHQLFAKQCKIALHYEKVEILLTQFEQRVLEFFARGGKGLNITLPFKERAFRLGAIATERAKRACAANTLWMHQGQLHADNTDGVGLVRDLTRFISPKHRSILILGAGGAARGIIAPLLNAGITKITVYNRTPAKAQALQHDFPEISLSESPHMAQGYDILINATAANLEGAPFQLQLPSNFHPFCYDLAYTLTGNTPFVTWAKQQKCTAVDGIGMLIEQAAESFAIWHGTRPCTEGIQEQLRK